MSKKIDKMSTQPTIAASTEQHTMHKTKIVATVGPACDSYDKLLELVRAGVNVFRLNFSHGSHEDKAQIITHIRNINESLDYNISILGDLQGPKLRVGDIENNSLLLTAGDILTFTNEKCVGTLEKIYVSYPNLADDVRVGNIIMIDDGKIEVKVVNITKDKNVKVEVTLGGILSSKKGLNLPDTKISLPALTDKDLIDLEFIIEQKCDWVALSFVRSVKDLVILRSKLDEKKSKTKIIAKIEKPEALVNIRDEIVYRFLKCNKNNASNNYPLITRYFYFLINGDAAALNGFVAGYAAKEDFTLSNDQYYLRRKVIIWSDLIKLNYQTLEICPKLWKKSEWR